MPDTPPPLPLADLLHRLEILADARDRMLSENASEIVIKPKKPTTTDIVLSTAVATTGAVLLLHDLMNHRPTSVELMQETILAITGLAGLALNEHGVLIGNPRKTPKENAEDLDLLIYDMQLG